MRTTTLPCRRRRPMTALAGLALLGACAASLAADPHLALHRPAGDCAAELTLADARRAERQAASARKEALLALAQAGAAEQRGLAAAERAAAERAATAAARLRAAVPLQPAAAAVPRS